MKPTYDELLAENTWLHKQVMLTREQVLADLIGELMADDKPLVRVKPEAYEYRIYELEIAYMIQLADTPESAAAYESMERVRANYLHDYPERPLNPKPRPSDTPAVYMPAFMGTPIRKERKPYTRKIKAA